MADADAATPAPRRALLVGAAGAAAWLLLVALVNTIGGPHDFLGALANDLYVLAIAGLAPAAYIAAAIGLGRLFVPLTREAREGPALRAALGVTTMLWISSALGSIHLGLDMGGRLLAGAPIAAGIGLLVAGYRRGAPVGPQPRHWPIVVAMALPATVLIAAALNPPGWLWSSEFGGYDALSYHLQLPQEWLAIGRIRPLEHNVYSFLPGYVEAAFAHIGVISGVERPYAPDASPTGLLTGAGNGAIAAQLLHAGLAILAGLRIAGAARLAVRRAGVEERTWTGPIAGAFYMATPWIIVTGSLAYNEMGVTGALAGALIVALEDQLSPAVRGLLAGWLIGIACACKPTAFFLAGVPLGLVLFGLMPARAWLACAGAGCLAGLVALAPWLVRNLVEAGNPVFPYATSIFGHAHWTMEQVERFHAAHHFDGSVLDRLRLMVLPDRSDPAGPRHRGLAHEQWFIFFPTAAVGAAVAVALARVRRVPLLLLAMMLFQLALWLFTTHIQSRFLIPLAVTGSVLVGMAFGGAGARGAPIAILLRTLGVLACTVQLMAATAIFARERGGRPNARLLASPSLLTGAGLDADSIRASSIPSVNRDLPEGAGLALLGDATPFYITRPVLYNTTWDAWPLGELIRAHPGDPAAWTAGLRARGVRYVLVDQVGLGVFWRSGTHDPAVTPDAVRAWLEDPSTRVVRSWDAEGRLLVELEGSEP